MWVKRVSLAGEYHSVFKIGEKFSLDSHHDVNKLKIPKWLINCVNLGNIFLYRYKNKAVTRMRNERSLANVFQTSFWRGWCHLIPNMFSAENAWQTTCQRLAVRTRQHQLDNRLEARQNMVSRCDTLEWSDLLMAQLWTTEAYNKCNNNKWISMPWLCVATLLVE